MSKRLVYLAGPISGITHGAAVGWRDEVGNRLATISKGQIVTASPMRGKRYLDDATPIARFNAQRGLYSTDQAIYRRDRNDVKRSNMVFVNLLGATKASIGTIMEIGWADAWDVPMVVVMEAANVHQHPILNQAGKLIVDNIDDALALTYEILRDDSF